MRLVIIDRDGVINYDSDDYIKSPDEFVPIPGSLEAITRLSQAGYKVVVATNQSGIARDYFNIETLGRIHEKLHRQLADLGGDIEAIFFCPHGPADNCDCRKPKAGLFEQIARRMHTELAGTPAIGDALRDIQAAQAVEAAPILVLTGKGKMTVERGEGLEGVPIYDDLAAAVDALLAQEPTL